MEPVSTGSALTLLMNIDDEPSAGRKAESSEATLTSMFCTRVRVEVLRNVNDTVKS